MFLQSDQLLVDGLPGDIRAKADGFTEEFILQTGIAWSLRNEPLPENYIPDSVDVFVGGDENACLFVYRGRVVTLTEEFMADRTKATIVIAIEDEPRYIQIHGELIVNALGDCALPDLLVTPAIQLAYLSKLLQH